MEKTLDEKEEEFEAYVQWHLEKKNKKKEEERKVLHKKLVKKYGVFHEPCPYCEKET